MAYLPFYLTPEEFELKQKQQEQEIAAGRGQIRWHKYDIEKPFRYFNYCISIAVCLPGYLLAFVLFERGETFSNSLMIGQALFLSGLAYLMFGLDYRYDYTLSEKGLVVKKRRNMPRWVNSAAQVVAWFGAGICVFMVATVGPMILAGAGGLILLSFTGLKRKPDEEAEVLVGQSEDWLFAYYNTQRKVIILYHKCDYCEYEDVAHTEIVRSNSRSGSYLFFRTAEEMDQVINTLRQSHQLECSEINNAKALFGLEAGRPEPLLKIPSRTMFYQKSEVNLLKQTKAPLPDWKYLYQGKFRTKEEIEKLQSQAMVAEE